MFLRSIILLLLILNFILANDTVIKGQGENIQPAKSADVQMVSELIYITYGKGLGFEVNVIATFKNHGPSVDLSVGFPFEVFYPGIEDDSLNEISKEYDPNFTVRADGIELETNEHLTSKLIAGYNVIYLFNLHFNENEIKIIEHKYTVGGSYGSNGVWNFNYIMKTGSNWKGKIESISIVLEIPKNDVPKFQNIIPSEHNAFEKDNNIFLTWKFEEIKPDFDLIASGSDDLLYINTKKEVVNLIKTKIDYLGNNRYYKNLIFALNGYPFKNPFVWNQFYNLKRYLYALPDIELKQNDNFKIEDIPSEQMELIKKLNE